MCSALDDAVASVAASLEREDVWSNTILIFSSDNGPAQGQGGSAYPLRGWKMQLWEGGVRVPAFVYSPLLPKAVRGTVDTRLYHITDWLPTLASACDLTLKAHKKLDGVDLWAALRDPALPSPRTEILHNLNQACGRGKMNGGASPSSALRLGDWN